MELVWPIAKEKATHRQIGRWWELLTWISGWWVLWTWMGRFGSIRAQGYWGRAKGASIPDTSNARTWLPPLSQVGAMNPAAPPSTIVWIYYPDSCQTSILVWLTPMHPAAPEYVDEASSNISSLDNSPHPHEPCPRDFEHLSMDIYTLFSPLPRKPSSSSNLFPGVFATCVLITNQDAQLHSLMPS